MSLYAVVFIDPESGKRQFCSTHSGEAHFYTENDRAVSACADLVKELKHKLDGSPVVMQNFFRTHTVRAIVNKDDRTRMLNILKTIQVAQVSSLAFTDGVEL